MASIGILGASGVVGYRLALWLQREGSHQVFPIVRNSMALSSLAVDFADVVMTGESDARRDFDVLINCARVTREPKLDITLNAAIARQTLEQYRARLHVQLSSVAIYGTPLDGTRSTFDRPTPTSIYGFSKRRVEAVCRSDRKPGTDLAVLRVGHVIGHGTNWSATIFDQCLNPAFALPFAGQRDSNVVTVGQIGRSILAMIDGSVTVNGFSVYNLVSEPQLSWREVFDMHSTPLGIEPVASMSEPESSRIRRELCDHGHRNHSLAIAKAVLAALRPAGRRSLTASPGFMESAHLLLARSPVPLFEPASRIWGAVKGRRAAGAARFDDRPAHASARSIGDLFSDAASMDSKLSSAIRTNKAEIANEVDAYAQAFRPDFPGESGGLQAATDE